MCGLPACESAPNTDTNGKLDKMSLCPHGINIKHRDCDRCQEIAEAEMRSAERADRQNEQKGGDAPCGSWTFVKKSSTDVISNAAPTVQPAGAAIMAATKWFSEVRTYKQRDDAVIALAGIIAKELEAEDLLYRYHNDARLHQFVQELIAHAIEAHDNDPGS